MIGRWAWPAPSWSRRWRGLCLRLGLGLLAFSPLWFFTPLEDAYLLPQRLALSLAALLLLASPSQAPLPQGPVWRLALAWLGWRVLCRGLAGGPGTLAWLAAQAPLWALLLAAALSLEDPSSRRLLAWALGLALGLEAVYAILGALGWDPLARAAVDLGFGARASGSLGNPDFLGGWLALLLPLALALAWQGAGSGRAWRWGLLALGATALVLTQARGAWLAAAAGMAAAAWRLRPGRRAGRVLAGGAMALVLALGLGWALSGAAQRQRLAEAADPGSDAWQSRWMMASSAVEMARANPWTGVGPGCFADPFLALQGPQLLADRGLPYRYTEDAHNDWAQSAAESGWPGLLLWAALWLLALRAAWRRGGAEGAAVAGGLVALGVQGCFHFPLSIVPCQGLLMAALGLCAAWEGGAESPAPAWPRWILALALVASLGLQWRQCQASACLNRGSALAGQTPASAWRLPLLERAVVLRPEDIRAWTRLGRACLDGQLAVPGEVAYGQATQLMPHLGEAWTGLALAQGMQGKLPEAEASGLRAVSLNPRAAEAWSNLAKVRYLRGQNPLAVDTAKQGLAQAEPNAGAWYNLAAMLYEQKRFQEAVPALRSCLQMDPSNTQAGRLLDACLHGR